MDQQALLERLDRLGDMQREAATLEPQFNVNSLVEMGGCALVANSCGRMSVLSSGQRNISRAQILVRVGHGAHVGTAT